MDPVICCLLGICCPPGSAEQLDILTQLLTKQLGAEKAKKVAHAVQKDLTSFTKKLKKAMDA